MNRRIYVSAAVILSTIAAQVFVPTTSQLAIAKGPPPDTVGRAQLGINAVPRQPAQPPDGGDEHPQSSARSSAQPSSPPGSDVSDAKTNQQSNQQTNQGRALNAGSTAEQPAADQPANDTPLDEPAVGDSAADKWGDTETAVKAPPAARKAAPPAPFAAPPTVHMPFALSDPSGTDGSDDGSATVDASDDGPTPDTGSGARPVRGVARSAASPASGGFDAEGSAEVSRGGEGSRGIGAARQTPRLTTSRGTRGNWSVSLAPGLNPIRFQGANGTRIETLVAAIPGRVEVVFRFDVPAQTWQTYVPGAPAFVNSFDTVNGFDVLFIRVPASVSFQFAVGGR